MALRLQSKSGPLLYACGHELFAKDTVAKDTVAKDTVDMNLQDDKLPGDKRELF